jgi:hypothetical protein
VIDKKIVGTDIPRFCRHFKIERVEQLPADRFEDALAALESKRGKS